MADLQKPHIEAHLTGVKYVGGGCPDAVLFTPQDLTPEQKKQVQKNIDAQRDLESPVELTEAQKKQIRENISADSGYQDVTDKFEEWHESNPPQNPIIFFFNNLKEGKYIKRKSVHLNVEVKFIHLGTIGIYIQCDDKNIGSVFHIYSRMYNHDRYDYDIYSLFSVSRGKASLCDYTAITERVLPIPFKDAGKIPVANSNGGYTLTTIENAEEVAV